MKKLSRKVLALLLVAALLVTVGCGKKVANNSEVEKTTVKIGYLPLTHALPLFEEKELLEASSNSTIEVELVIFGSFPELLDALNTGRIDGASVLIELAIKSIDEGNKLKIAALGHRDGNAVIVAKDIESASDLKGKTFAIPHRMSSHNILLHELLEKNGLKIEEINVVELAPAEMPAALASGQISGYCVAEPFGAKAIAIDAGKVLYQSNELWEDSTCCGLVLTQAFIDEKADIAKEYVKQYLEAGNQLDKEEAVTVATKYLGQEKDVLDLSLEWISYKDLTFTEETYQDLLEKLKKYQIFETSLSYEDVIYQ